MWTRRSYSHPSPPQPICKRPIKFTRVWRWGRGARLDAATCTPVVALRPRSRYMAVEQQQHVHERVRVRSTCPPSTHGKGMPDSTPVSVPSGMAASGTSTVSGINKPPPALDDQAGSPRPAPRATSALPTLETPLAVERRTDGRQTERKLTTRQGK